METKTINEKKAICTIILLAINVIVFFYLSFLGMTEDGEFLLAHGAMYVPYVLEGQEYYRIVTSMFLHFGFEHLMNNMLLLAVIGWNLELEIGKVKFLIIYLLSGICGNALSAYAEICTGDYAISAGASGAVFGIIGALLYVAIRNKGRIGEISGKGILFMIALSMYFGFTSEGVDNLAHIGGVVSGFLLAVLLYWKRKDKPGTSSEGGVYG